MVRRPVVSSMRSRQTGQVGSSIRDGVLGARGLAVVEVDVVAKGSSDIVGYVGGPEVVLRSESVPGDWVISTDFRKTT
jgi:hypothetical protein